MADLFNMDLYRMVKARSFRICLALSFLVSLAHTPLLKLLDVLAKMFSQGGEHLETLVGPSANLSGLIGRPFPLLAPILIMLSVILFYYADMENGYIKNIAGQMPKRGFSILSRFLASAVHNAVFAAVCLIGGIIGTAMCQKIVADGAVVNGVVCFFLKLMLLQSLCAVLLMVTSSLRSKSFGIVLATLFGVGATGLIYSAVDSGLNMLVKGFAIAPYMPDTLMETVWNAQTGELQTLRAILSAAVTTGIFLPAAISIFDKKDVK